MEIKKGIPQEEIEFVLEWGFNHFKEIIDKKSFKSIVNTHTNWYISAKLVDENNKLMGVYLLGDCQLFFKNDEISLEGKIGVEGVLLAIDKEIRGQGWGEKLKDYPKTLDVDYVWGQQFKALNNLDA